MMRKLLVALDGTPTSEALLPTLETLVGAQDADVTLARVIPNPDGTQADEICAYLNKIAARLRAKGMVIDTHVRSGEPAESLIQMAVQGGYSMILMGSKARTGLPRLVFGSVAEEVARRSPVPVLVVPAGAEEHPKLRRILVPLDGSYRSASILEHLVPLAKATGARLLFMTVVDPHAKDGMPVEVVARNLFREQKKLHRRGVQSELLIRYGDPAAEILTCAKGLDADLVALSTHGRSGLDRARYGSVAESVLRQGHLPVLVLRTAGVYEYDPMHAPQIRAERERTRALAK